MSSTFQLVESEHGSLLMVGDRKFPCLSYEHSDLDGVGGYVYRFRRALLMFESGYEASVVWGSYSYSDNYDSSNRYNEFTETPETVEIGVIKDGELVGDPLGYVSVKQALEIFDNLNCGRLPTELTVTP